MMPRKICGELWKENQDYKKGDGEIHGIFCSRDNKARGGMMVASSCFLLNFSANLLEIGHNLVLI